jgi:hypothetical protein
MREGLRSRTKDKSNGTYAEKAQNGAIATGVESKLPPVERTDYSLWRLKVKHGRQTWHYITPEEETSWPQSVPEKYHLGLPTVYLGHD